MSVTKLLSQASHGVVLSQADQVRESKRLMKFVLVSAVTSFVMIEPSVVFAGAQFGNLGTLVTNIQTFLTGAFGRSIATIAVIVMGMMAMFGKLQWEHAIKVIIGIAIVFGAASIINALGGNMQANIAG